LLKRDDLGFPTFWPVQIIGWSCFYLLMLVSMLPSLKTAGALWEMSVPAMSMFAGSCLLRPVCRSLLRRELPWISLEIRAFVFSLGAGAVAGLVSDLLEHGRWRPFWADWLDTSVQCTLILFLWSSLYFSIKQWQRSARERERLLRAEAEVRDARLRALRYQLNPHFLFNSLNAVSTLVLDGNAPAATRMLAQIAELLRTILESQAVPETPLSQEIAFTEQYLAIEQIRLGGRLRVELTISPETLDALVPSMLLQPLVENAVRHGVAALVEGGVIRIQSAVHDARLQLKVGNSGAPGTGLGRPRPFTNGIGLNNTVQRLETLYAADHKFMLRWPEAGGCEVSIELPFRESPRQQEVPTCAS
jgi:hypothetical protein